MKMGPQHQDRTNYGRERLRNLSMQSEGLFVYYQEAVARQHGLGDYLEEIHRLDREIVADFRSAGAASRFNATALIDAVIERVDPRLFGVPQVRLRFDQNTIELPDGRIMYGIQTRITRQPEVADEADAPAIEHPPILNAATVPSELASVSAKGRTLELGEARTTNEPRPAPDPEIHNAITGAYDEAAEADRKPPNIREIVGPVQTRLSAQGYKQAAYTFKSWPTLTSTSAGAARRVRHWRAKGAGDCHRLRTRFQAFSRREIWKSGPSDCEIPLFAHLISDERARGHHRSHHHADPTVLGCSRHRPYQAV